MFYDSIGKLPGETWPTISKCIAGTQSRAVAYLAGGAEMSSPDPASLRSLRRGTRWATSDVCSFITFYQHFITYTYIYIYYYIIAIITNILVVHGYTLLNPKPVTSMLTNLAKDLGHHLLVGHQHHISTISTTACVLWTVYNYLYIISFAAIVIWYHVLPLYIYIYIGNIHLSLSAH